MVRVDVEGEAARRQVEEISGNDLPPTWEFRSGRADGSGFGIIYSIPSGVVFRTTPQFFQDGELRFQAQGAQSVLPPSRHPSGRRYEWLPGKGPGDIPLAPAPRWAVARWSVGPGGGRQPRPASSRSADTSAAAGATADSNLADVALALAALENLDPGRASGYDTWLKVGMVLHAVENSDEMLVAWDEWSQQCESKYQPDVCADKWATFKSDGGLLLCDLLRWAHRDTGWVPAQPRQPQPPQPQRTHRSLLRRRRRLRPGHSIISFTVEVR
jgi:hypothetical protein